MDRIEAAFLALWPNPPPGTLQRFLNGTDADRTLIIETIKDLGNAPGPSAWSVFLVVLGAVGQFASLVMPITGLISGVYGVATLGR